MEFNSRQAACEYNKFHLHRSRKDSNIYRHAAVAFHNGTAKHVGTTSGSAEYRALMNSIAQGETSREPQKRFSRCYRKPSDVPSIHPCDQGFLSCILHLLQLPQQIWRSYSPQTTKEESPLPIDPKVQLFKEQLEMLLPFYQMTATERSQVSVSIVIPPWLKGTNETCEIFEAASMVLGQGFPDESTPSAVYTAMGYELHRISPAFYKPVVPGRIMTVDFEDDLVTAALVETPLTYHFNNPVEFAVARNFDGDNFKHWLRHFVKATKPDIMVIIGGNASDTEIQEAITTQSEVATFRIDQSANHLGRIKTLGAALAARTWLERQRFDCLEVGECLTIRDEANRLAGNFTRPVPSVWGARALHQPDRQSQEQHTEL